MFDALRKEKEEDFQGYYRDALPRKAATRNRAFLNDSLEFRQNHKIAKQKIKPESKITLEVRSALIFFVLILIFSYLLGNIYQLQEDSSDRWEKLASKQHSTSKSINGVRGSIFDRKSRPLAVSIQTFKAGVDPKKKPDYDIILPLLKKEFGKSYSFPNDYLKKERFFWFANSIHPDSSLKNALSKMKGVTLNSQFQRFYPQGDLASTLVGKVGIDGNGLSGIEKYFDEKLLAKNKKINVKRDAKGRSVAEALNSTAYKEFRNEGNQLSISIDSAIQSIMAEETSLGRLSSDAKAVMAMMMEAETGEILGVVQTKSFNPNTVKILKASSLRSPALQNSFEPGSTIKPLVVASAIDKGFLSEREIIDCENGRFKFGRHVIRDTKENKVLTVPEILANSSNVCMTKIANRFSLKEFHRSLENLEFGAGSGLEWGGAAKGVLRDVDRLKDIDLATFSFGYGFSVSMAQMLKAYSAIANQGLMPEASFLLSEKGEGAESKLKRVFSKETSMKVKEMLSFVVENESGTAKNARVNNLKVYGKTGTANKAKLEGPGYSKDRVNASFIGFVQNPKNKKHLVLYVIVDEPMVKRRYGGVVAAPIFSSIMERTVDYYNSAS